MLRIPRAIYCVRIPLVINEWNSDISIILIILSLIMILLKISVHSPSETTIIFSVVGILLALQVVVISILFQIKEDIGNLKEFKRQTIVKINEFENRF